MKYVLPILTCLQLFLSVQGQKTGDFLEKTLEYAVPFTITQYSTRNGLSQNQVLALEPTPNGLLYLSTGSGVFSFNGQELKEIVTDKEYRTYSFHKLEWNETFKTLIGYDPRGYVFRLLPDFKEIRISEGQTPSCIHVDRNSLIIGTNSGEVYSCQLQETNSIKFRFKLPSRIDCFLINGDRLYAGTTTGLYSCELISGKISKLSDDVFRELKPNPYSGKLYGISGTKVVELGAQILEKFRMPFNDEKAYCTDLEFVGDTVFYLATTKGLYCVGGEKTDHYSAGNALSSNNLSALYYNNNYRCLFAGTNDKGFMKIQFKAAYSLYKKQGLSESSIASIIQTQDGKILLAETCCNIYELKPDTIVVYNKLKAYFSVLAEIDNSLACGTWGGGLFVLNNGVVTDSIASPSIPGNDVHAIYKDSKGKIWIGASGGLACGTQFKNIQPFLSKKIHSRINVIYELKNGNICAGGVDGFFILANGSVLKHIGKKAGLESKAVRCFYEDEAGKLWIGTYGGGVYCYAGDSLVSINSRRGCLLFEDAFCLAPDGFGNLFITSNYGLWRVPFKALDEFYHGKRDVLVPEHYTEESGILNTEFNGGFQNNYLKTGNRFYFPNIEGVVTLIPQQQIYKKAVPVIESICINDDPLTTTNTRFPRNTFLIKLKASCADFSAAGNVFYQYKLSNGSQDGRWSLPQKENTFNFYLLPPGNYQLAVRVVDAANDIHPEEVTYAFSIEPYFYETFFFKLVALFATLIAIVIIVRMRLHIAKRRAEENERYNRRLAEIELTAIQAQLNPHFIFNCLNAIKYSIMAKDFEGANQSLNTFSAMIRDSLENSEKLFLPFDKTFRFIANYIELEKLRLGEQLSFELTVDPNIKRGQLIPHLILQPYIENAIKHGIANLENKQGVLSVKFKRGHGNITCIITDNGIGRDAARKLTGKNKLHVSRGTKLTVEKAAFLRRYNNYNCTIDIKDLYSLDNKAEGTSVTIIIPDYDDNWNN